eukprot:TRINITY_DN3348_c0_g1_i1.p1 TRINITY_DN3348_c0_g1~~TRINITY_DN3348_c0_g1_i1.p1  ORF type:complete len:597 (+),score=137.19 TRINITY_DN3348_c0_g1_i1:181-1791(+)
MDDKDTTSSTVMLYNPDTLHEHCTLFNVQTGDTRIIDVRGKHAPEGPRSGQAACIRRTVDHDGTSLCTQVWFFAGYKYTTRISGNGLRYLTLRGLKEKPKQLTTQSSTSEEKKEKKGDKALHVKLQLPPVRCRQVTSQPTKVPIQNWNSIQIHESLLVKPEKNDDKKLSDFIDLLLSPQSSSASSTSQQSSTVSSSLSSSSSSISSTSATSVSNSSSSSSSTTTGPGIFMMKPGRIKKLCEKAIALFRNEPTVLELEAPLKIFGDVHGQFADLQRLFWAYDSPHPVTGDLGVFKYLFLGDAVDRGDKSLEVICLLLALKVKYPTRIFLLRGNHEDAELNKRYGFYNECKARIDKQKGDAVWQKFTEVWSWLPIGARVNHRIFCLHGGIGRIRSIQQIAALQRPLEVDKRNLVVLDALWSDPAEDEKVEGIKTSPRGTDFVLFGADVVKRFVKENDIDVIIRSHQCVKEGFEPFAGGHLITVFSATDYEGHHKNCGAFLEVTARGDEILVQPNTYEPSGFTAHWLATEESKNAMRTQ